MQTTVSALEKKAIKFALLEDWENAITTNLELLELEPNDIKAKIRLGRAYLQTENFTNAENLFEEVLKQDPINTIAQKNYELAKSKKTQNNSKTYKGSFIKEPGTTAETEVVINNKGFTAESFCYGESLEVKLTKNKVFINKDNTAIAEVTEDKILKRIQYAHKLNANIRALFIKGEGSNITLLIKSSEPVFKGDRQDIKPYLKKGSIEEPELEIESFDDE